MITPEQFTKIQQQMGLSDKKMAEFLGIKDRSTIHRYRTGKREIPGTVIKILELARRLAEDK